MWGLGNQGNSSSPILLRTLDPIAHPVSLQIHTRLVDPVLGAELNSQGSTAVNVTLPHTLPDGTGHTDHGSDHRTRQPLTADPGRALWTGAFVVRTTGGTVVTRGHTGGGHRCLTETPSKVTGTATSVEAHTHATIFTGLLALHRLYLAASALPPYDTRAFVDIYAPPSVLTGWCAQR